MGRLGLRAFVVVAGLAFATPAVAQAQAPQAAPDKLEEARQRYQRGLQLFNEQNYEAARVEFERAYTLAPSYKILYNIGLAYEQLGDYVQAQTTLQKYLEQGGSEITAERRSEVAKELAQIRPRIATVTIHTNVAGAEVMMDDTCGTDVASGNINCGSIVGNSRAIYANPGRRRITMRKEGYLPETQTVTLAGSDHVDVEIRLKELPKGYVEKKTNPWTVPTIIGWSATGVGLVTTTVVGILALNAKSSQNNKLKEIGETSSDLSDARSKTTTLSTVADIAGATTIVFAGVSTYFTLKMISNHPNDQPTRGSNGPTVNVSFGPGSVGAFGSF
jgi:hypothetical protein